MPGVDESTQPRGADECDCGGACKRCRMRALARLRRRYHFTPELIDELRRAYCGRKHQISKALDALQRRTGWPRHAFKYEAARRGWITADHRRRWAPEELAILEEKLGIVSVRQIAKNLKRTVLSVESKAERLQLSLRLREGYNMTDLGKVFGESQHKIRRWIERGLFRKSHRHGLEVRINERDVVRFIRMHAAEYDLRRVDQHWYKGMLFADLAGYGDRV